MTHTTEYYAKKLAELFPKTLDALTQTPACKLEVSSSGFWATVSSFHWLSACVRYHEHLSKSLESYTNNSGSYSIWQDAENWLKSIGATVTERDNTYNHENLLDRDVCYYFFSMPEEENYIDLGAPLYVMLWVHQRGDVRGNYSFPAIFEVTDYEVFVTGTTHATITNNSDFRLWTDDAYHWYDDYTREPDLTFAPLSDLYPFDPQQALAEMGTYQKVMKEAGRDPEPQLQQALARVQDVEKLAIKRTDENPKIVYYTDEGKGYVNGQELKAVPNF